MGSSPVIGSLGVRRPALREGPDVLLGLRISGLSRDPARDANALFDDLAVAELGEALGGAQHASSEASPPARGIRPWR